MNASNKAQSGMTLVSLMIGMLISTVGILASLTLYKTLVSVSAEAKADAMHDGQLATTLLAIQLKVQNAGFGLNSTAEHIVIVDGETTKHLYWRYRIAGVTYCEGLRRYSRDTQFSRGLAIDYLVAGNNTCSETSALSSMTWSSTSTLSVFPKEVTSIVDFSLAEQACSPYGMDTAEDNYVLTLSGKTAANITRLDSSGTPLDDTELKLCLPNIHNT